MYTKFPVVKEFKKTFLVQKLTHNFTEKKIHHKQFFNSFSVVNECIKPFLIKKYTLNFRKKNTP